MQEFIIQLNNFNHLFFAINSCSVKSQKKLIVISKITPLSLLRKKRQLDMHLFLANIIKTVSMFCACCLELNIPILLNGYNISYALENGDKHFTNDIRFLGVTDDLIFSVVNTLLRYAFSLHYYISRTILVLQRMLRSCKYMPMFN